jgi:hypothetical protein
VDPVQSRAAGFLRALDQGGRRLAKAERESQADENCDWLLLGLAALDGDEAARAKIKRAARERWPSYERFWAPFRPGGSHYKPHLMAVTDEADEEGMGWA